KSEAIVGENSSDVSSVLSKVSKLYEETQEAVDNVFSKGLEPFSRTSEFFVKAFKAYSIVEPTTRETKDADKALRTVFGLTSGLLPDTNDSMNTFCEQLKERQEIVHNYVVRKYTFNMICRLAFHLAQNAIHKQNDFYCESPENREEFMRNAIQMKQYDKALAPIRYEFKLNLIAIQDTNLGFSKLRAFC
ncbi:unnamed protein product, partial [Medioppia subpectinata]